MIARDATRLAVTRHARHCISAWARLQQPQRKIIARRVREPLASSLEPQDFACSTTGAALRIRHQSSSSSTTSSPSTINIKQIFSCCATNRWERRVNCARQPQKQEHPAPSLSTQAKPITEEPITQSPSTRSKPIHCSPRLTQEGHHHHAVVADDHVLEPRIQTHWHLELRHINMAVSRTKMLHAEAFLLTSDGTVLNRGVLPSVSYRASRVPLASLDSFAAGSEPSTSATAATLFSPKTAACVRIYRASSSAWLPSVND